MNIWEHALKLAEGHGLNPKQEALVQQYASKLWDLDWRDETPEATRKIEDVLTDLLFASEAAEGEGPEDLE